MGEDRPTLCLVGLRTIGSKEVPPSDALRLIRERLEEMLMTRLGLLSEEAGTLSADMNALGHRLRALGVIAQIDDVHAGRLYRTVAEVRVLQELYSYMSALMGEAVKTLRPRPAEDSGPIVDPHGPDD